MVCSQFGPNMLDDTLVTLGSLLQLGKVSLGLHSCCCTFSFLFYGNKYKEKVPLEGERQGRSRIEI